jgi:hypothetical protein
MHDRGRGRVLSTRVAQSWPFHCGRQSAPAVCKVEHVVVAGQVPAALAASPPGVTSPCASLAGDESLAASESLAKSASLAGDASLAGEASLADEASLVETPPSLAPAEQPGKH